MASPGAHHVPAPRGRCPTGPHPASASRAGFARDPECANDDHSSEVTRDHTAPPEAERQAACIRHRARCASRAKGIDHVFGTSSDDDDHIETRTRMGRVLCEPPRRGSHEESLLARTDALDGIDSRLSPTHLDEDDDVTVLGHQVDLAPPCTSPTSENAHALLRQKDLRACLGVVAFLLCVRAAHDEEPRSGSSTAASVRIMAFWTGAKERRCKEQGPYLSSAARCRGVP